MLRYITGIATADTLMNSPRTMREMFVRIQRLKVPRNSHHL